MTANAAPPRSVDLRPQARTSWVTFEYRPALNGLRAIAALLVVLFHAGMPGMANGYVGVDVFFVLSGFLITSLIAREYLVEYRIHMLRFYARRVRRLLPAALLVLLVTAAVYEATAPPIDVLENRWGFAAAALYVSNWFFLGQSQDYFAQEASPSPVLHYWSLSVEEQFYLAFPLVMLLLFAIPLFRRRLAPYVMAVLALGGLALSAWLASGSNPMDSYFGTLGRAYQLLFGAALAMAMLWLARSNKEPSKWVQRMASVTLLLGLAGLIVASTTSGPQSPFWAGVASAGATVVVLGSLELGARGPAGRVLVTPVAVWLGIWSYAIYLWHWPVVVLGDINGWIPEAWYFRVPMVTGLSIVLAALTWLLVERPVDALKLSTLRRQKSVVSIGIFGTVATAVGCTAILWPSAAAQNVYDTAFAGAYQGFAGTVQGGDSQAKRTLLVVGDSHAMFWRKGLEELAVKRGFKLVFVTRSACPWNDVDAVNISTGEDFQCDQRLRNPALAAMRKYQPDVTVLVSRSMTVRDVRTDDDEEIPVAEPGWAEQMRAGMTEFLADASRLTDRIVMVEPMPETSESMLSCLSTGAHHTECSQPQQDSAGIAIVEDLQREVAKNRQDVVSVSLDDLICPDDWCPAQRNGVITHRDQHHLTDQYAAVLAPALLEVLSRNGAAVVRQDS